MNRENSKRMNQGALIVLAVSVLAVCVPTVWAQTNTFPDNGNVGIGTTSPSDKLSIESKSNQVISSTQSYDTRVAGVISAQRGITLGEKSESKVLVATTGRVKVRVDASKSPIQIGDLLVTSDVPGVAMKSKAVNLGGVQFHRPGTLIGKALEPLAKGKGEILVLLSLQ